MADSIDTTLAAFAFVFPVVAVLRWGVRGIWIGAAGQWAALALAGHILSILDPASRTGFTAIADRAWLVFGWIFSVAYGGLVYGLKLVWSFLCPAHPRLPGLCPTCGYDLRATPDRCPECGTAPR